MAYPADVLGSGGTLNDYVFRSVLKDGTRVLLRSVKRKSDAALIESMFELLNFEIDQGNTYPMEKRLTRTEFEQYFLSCEAFALLSGTDPQVQPVIGNSLGRFSQTSADGCLIGCFYVKPNWPGRCSHVCNGGFLVSPAFRGLGAGFIMGEQYRLLAQRLGFHSSMFNLVFETNIPSNRLWHRLGFVNSGVVRRAGRIRLPSNDEEVNSLKEKVQMTRSIIFGTNKEYQKNRLILDAEGASEGEAFVDAFQWQLDLRQPLVHIVAPWIEAASKL